MESASKPTLITLKVCRPNSDPCVLFVTSSLYLACKAESDDGGRESERVDFLFIRLINSRAIGGQLLKRRYGPTVKDKRLPGYLYETAPLPCMGHPANELMI